MIGKGEGILFEEMDISSLRSIVRLAKNSPEEYNFFFNSGGWDGKPFPGNLNYLIKIPINKVIEGYDGAIRVKEIKLGK